MSGLLRNVMKSNSLPGRINPPYQGLALLLRGTPPKQHFSTGTQEEEPKLPEAQLPRLPLRQDSPFDPNRVYAKLLGAGKHTLKTDVINLLEGCNLSPQDIKIVYDRMFNPISMVVRFHYRAAYESAVRVVIRKRLYRLEQADPRMWDIQSYDGKTVILHGIPRSAQQEDIERMLSGFEVNSHIEMLLRQGYDPFKLALVQFPSQMEATSAVHAKNRSFCLNNQIKMRVLQ